MMSQPARHWISVAEYLQMEEIAEYKSEYCNGEVFAMAGGTARHSAIAANLARELGTLLEAKPCQVFNSDLRVKVPNAGFYTYPDVSVVCSEPLFEDAAQTTLLNPLLIVEVLSESTEAYDRGAKFEYYSQLLSLQEYVLVASDRRRIERFTRQKDGCGWLLVECRDPEGSLELPSIGCVLSLPRVYLKVEFPPRLRRNSESRPE